MVPSERITIEFNSRRKDHETVQENDEETPNASDCYGENNGSIQESRCLQDAGFLEELTWRFPMTPFDLGFIVILAVVSILLVVSGFVE